MSKTTKLLLLDSLLQEVCIESGSDGSLALSSLGLSVCLVSHNLLYSGLKKAHLKMRTKSTIMMSSSLIHCVETFLMINNILRAISYLIEDSVGHRPSLLAGSWKMSGNESILNHEKGFTIILGHRFFNVFLHTLRCVPSFTLNV